MILPIFLFILYAYIIDNRFPIDSILSGIYIYVWDIWTSVECFYTHTCELGKGVYAHVTKTDIQ